MTNKQIKALMSNQNYSYGYTIHEEDFADLFGIKLPDLHGDRHSISANVANYELNKMGIYSTINEMLLLEGMCFIKNKEFYEIPLISEITQHISKYYNSSNNKFKRAEKLRKSFSKLHPVEAKEVNNTVNKEYTRRAAAEKQYQPISEH